MSRRRVFDGGRPAALSALVGIAGLVVCGFGLWLEPDRLWFSYLMAFAFAASIAVGALIFLMIGYAVNARWIAVVRRLLEAIALSLPALAILFVPIAFGADSLYPWRDPPPGLPHHVMKIIHHREPYLNLTFFVVRTGVYFLIWIVAAEVLRRWSVRRRAGDVADVEAAVSRERVLSSVMLPAVALAITFAAFDWLMTLEAVWFSTIFGVYYFAGGFLAALALLTLLAYRARETGALGEEITPNHFHALGRLLLAFTIFWAYAAFFQAMLIRIANKPEEVVFYIDRIEGTWSAFVYILVLGHFAVPFLALLPRRLKFRPRTMAIVSAWLLLMHLCDVYWIVLPPYAEEGFAPHWLDLGALAAVLGLAGAFAAWRQRGLSLLAENDPCLPEGLEYRSPL